MDLQDVALFWLEGHRLCQRPFIHLLRSAVRILGSYRQILAAGGDHSSLLGASLVGSRQTDDLPGGALDGERAGESLILDIDGRDLILLQY